MEQSVAQSTSAATSSRQVLDSQKRILEILIRGESLEQILGEVCQVIERVVAGSRCAVMMHEKVTHRLHVAAAPSLAADFREALDGLDVGPRGASCGAAVHHGKTVVVEDVAGNPIWRDLQDSARAQGIRSCWSIPLRSIEGEKAEARITGTLDFYFQEVQKYSEAQLSTLESASELASYVLHNAQSRSSVQQKNSYDSLTDLPNRTLLTTRLRKLIEEKRSKTEDERGRFAVVALDLDRFKNINDTLGFKMGDLLLQALGQRLQGCLREYDTVSRSGGDDFLLVIQDLRRDDDISLVAEKILKRINDPYDFGGHGLFVTASMGISVYPWDGEDAQTLLRNAETALVSAKERGGGNFQFFRPNMARNNPTFESWFEQAKLASELRDVLDRDEIQLYYQLKYSSDGKQILGAEALIRWNHPTHGLLSPDRFLPMAEQMGMLVQLGEWCLYEACNQNKQWQDSGLARIPVSVNVSPQQFRHGHMIDTIREALKATGLPAQYLELEIVESLAMEDTANNQQRLNELHHLGLQLSIDDFGTGFSSLSYLNKFPFDAIKIDRSFVKDIGTGNDGDLDSQTIVLAILSMAQKLSLTVIAEGVETVEQARFLQDNQCEIIQGFLYARPEPGDKVTEKLIARS